MEMERDRRSTGVCRPGPLGWPVPGGRSQGPCSWSGVGTCSGSRARGNCANVDHFKGPGSIVTRDRMPLDE